MTYYKAFTKIGGENGQLRSLFDVGQHNVWYPTDGSPVQATTKGTPLFVCDTVVGCQNITYVANGMHAEIWEVEVMQPWQGHNQSCAEDPLSMTPERLYAWWHNQAIISEPTSVILAGEIKLIKRVQNIDGPVWRIHYARGDDDDE